MLQIALLRRSGSPISVLASPTGGPALRLGFRTLAERTFSTSSFISATGTTIVVRNACRFLALAIALLAGDFSEHVPPGRRRPPCSKRAAGSPRSVVSEGLGKRCRHRCCALGVPGLGSRVEPLVGIGHGNGPGRWRNGGLTRSGGIEDEDPDQAG